VSAFSDGPAGAGQQAVPAGPDLQAVVADTDLQARPAGPDLQAMLAESGLQAVLWDLDGTLVDTEPAWMASEYRLVELFGGSWSTEHAKAVVGHSLLESAAYLRKHGGVELSLEEIVDQMVADVLAAVQREVVWRPGALSLLADVRAAGVPCAMVTMSYQSLANSVASHLPAGTFQAMVTGDQVSRGKPHPEPYLTAAELLGVQPSRCVAIEDSPTGVASAAAAGCLVLAVQNQVPLAGAPGRIVLDSLEGIGMSDLLSLMADRTEPGHGPQD
jgi:HAD superfamily hydrolase (TIGR01509 family)